MSAKDRAKAFMFVCIGVAAVVIAVHLGTGTAIGQAQGGSFVAYEYSSTQTMHYALTSEGDAYRRPDGAEPWQYWGNIIESAGVIPAQSESWGSVKRRFKGGE
jgi:hypothetical protein